MSSLANSLILANSVAVQNLKQQISPWRKKQSAVIVLNRQHVLRSERIPGKQAVADLLASGAQVIPSVNDDLQNARLTAEFVGSLKGAPEVNILPFHKAATDKHERFGLEYRMEEATEASEEQLSSICSVMEENGLKVKIGG